jgi:enterochelin esterase-like enzyme
MAELRPSFTRISVSDPEFESEGLRFVTIQSPALRGRGDITLYVPLSAGSRDVPLVILLHGVYGSHWDWAYKGGAHHVAHTLIAHGDIGPAVLAMPSDGLRGYGTAYTRQRNADFERWIAEDVIHGVAEALQRTMVWPAVFIAGLSMGGFGALRLGARYPDRFRGMSAHSSVTHIQQMSRFHEDGIASYQFEPDDDGSVLAALLATREALPSFRFDCGEDDALIGGNRALHKALEEAAIPHVYQEFAGGHSWAYWRVHLRDTLRFFDRLYRE